jgi:hypothetical protein
MGHKFMTVKDQQILAKKAINGVLFKAKLGTLTRESIVINEPETHFSSSSSHSAIQMVLQHGTFLPPDILVPPK